MVNRIVNIKPLQQQTATMLTGHMSKQVDLYPDTQRDNYNPSEIFTITLNAIDVDYISFEDSVLWAKVKTTSTGNIHYCDINVNASRGKSSWSNIHTRFKFPALGGASYIERFRIFAGTTEIQDYEKYYFLWGTLAEMAAPRGFENYENMLMNSRASPKVVEMMRSDGDSHLNDPATALAPATAAPPAGTPVKGTYDVWIQIPLLSVFNDAGYIPNYQMGNKIKLEFKLTPNDLPYRAGYSPGNTAAVSAAVYGNVEYVPNTQWTVAVPAAATIMYIEESKFSWVLKNIVLRVNGLTVLQGGQLDAQPVEIFTHSYSVMTSPTTGGADERIPFQIKKSSIRKLHAIFTDAQVSTNQDWNRSSIDQWCRAGTVGSVNRSTVDTGTWPVEVGKEYNPSITWFAVELGGKRFPTSFGTGANRHPDNVHENVHEMFRAYQRFNGRNDVSGAIFPASLTPMNEGSHGGLSDSWDVVLNYVFVFP